MVLHGGKFYRKGRTSSVCYNRFRELESFFELFASRQQEGRDYEIKTSTVI